MEKYDKDLAVEFSQKKSVALTSERFRNVLSSFDCQNYPKIVKAELELLKGKGLLDKITFCSYRAVICKLNTLPKLSAAAESKCCEVFQILKEGGFVIHDEFSRDWDSWVSLTESGFLHSAAESGLVEIVKILLKLGADPLSIVGKYRGNDGTVIHAIHRKLCRTESGLGLSSAYLGPQKYMSDDLRKRITKVLHVMMKHANCTDISQLPYATPYIDFEADPKFAKKVTRDVINGCFVLKFKIDRDTFNESSSDFEEELSDVLYPRIAKLLKKIDFDSDISEDLPRYERLKKKAEAAIKEDEIDARRATVSCGMKRFLGNGNYDEIVECSSDDGF